MSAEYLALSLLRFIFLAFSTSALLFSFEAEQSQSVSQSVRQRTRDRHHFFSKVAPLTASRRRRRPR